VRPHDGATFWWLTFWWLTFWWLTFWWLTFWWLTFWVDVQAWNMVLPEFAAWLGCGPRKKVLLVVDCAGWHTGDQVELPQGLELVFLPPRSPELQPCERLWPLSNEAICNRHFDSLDQLEREQSRHYYIIRNSSRNRPASTGGHNHTL